MDHGNPLSRLIELTKLQQLQHLEQNILLLHLIESCANTVKLDTKDILYDSFENPRASAFLYTILFENCFKNMTVHHTVLQHLDTIWTTWEESGLKSEQVWKLKHYSDNQKYHFHQIWDYVGKSLKKQYQVESLFDKSQKELQEKIKIKDKVFLCLNTYCKEGNDRDKYLTFIQQMQEQFDRQFISSIKVPLPLYKLLPYADQLNPFVTSLTWMKFYEQEKNIEGAHTDVITEAEDSNLLRQGNNNTEEDNGWFDEDYSTATINNIIDHLEQQQNDELAEITLGNTTNVSKKQQLTTTVELDEIQPKFADTTCLELVTKASTYLASFQNRLKVISKQWKTTPVQNILNLFSNAEQINHEMQILKSSLDPESVQYIAIVIEYWKNCVFLKHFCRGSKYLLQYFQIQPDNDTYALFDKLLKINEQTKGYYCYLYYEQYTNAYAQKYSQETLGICSQYSSSHELIDFLHGLTAKDVDNLLEAVNDWDETLISTKTVIDFVTLKTYLDRIYSTVEKLKTDKAQITLSKIFSILADVLNNDAEFKNVNDFFHTCSLSLAGIKQLHMELTNKEQSKRTRIFNIIQESSLTFTQNIDMKKQFDVQIMPQNLIFADLSELRDRARLIEYSGNNKLKKRSPEDDENEIRLLRSFVTFISVVEGTLKNLSLLYVMGHPDAREFVASNTVFTCTQCKYPELINFSDKLTYFLRNWETTLCQSYEKYPDLTYFSCEQFWIIANYFCNHEKLNEEDCGYQLIRYIGLRPHRFDGNLQPKRGLKAEERLENLGKFLLLQHEHPVNNTQQYSTYPQINNTKLDKKFFVIETTNDGILRAILSLFHLTDNQPQVNQLFYCNVETSWMEIRAFIYRCFYTNDKIHQLIRPERLSPEIQDQFTPLIKSLLVKEPQRLFRMGIITEEATVQLVNALKTTQLVKILRDTDLLNQKDLDKKIQSMVENCTVVTSRITGLGKTSYIQQQCQKLGKQLIKFPISGDLSVDNIGKRLLKFSTLFCKSTIHFGIGSIKNSQLLNEVIYCLCLFRSFCFSQIAVNIPMETPLYFELDSSPFSDLQQNIVLFRCVKPTQFDNAIWNELNFNQPRVQFVANYLQAINDKTILQRDINLENMQNLDGPTCLRLIQNYFLKNKKPEYITWTQFNIFVSVFHTLFTGFSKCGYFLVDCLDQPQLRMDIVQAFLKSSDQFTSISVEAVRQQQRSVGDNTLQLEFSDAIVRWDKTQPFTLVFTSTDDPLFVYKTSSDIPKSLVDYFNHFYRTLQATVKAPALQATIKLTAAAASMMPPPEVQNIFPDYSQLSHVQFFLKLASLSKKYFNKSICGKCFRQYPYDTEKCTQCVSKYLLVRPQTLNNDDITLFQTQIAALVESEYVLTPDNYIKMLLIYLRIQSGLPVVIMGETGCGKTALINFLCNKILDDELEVLRIHAGFTVTKIIETMTIFMQKAEGFIQEAKEKAAAEKALQQKIVTNKNDACLNVKRLWVFFDEFNTTANIDLIKEITCERTMMGEKLPENMVFLGACNPRRHKTEKTVFDDNIGIKKNRYEMQKLNTADRLLYTVVQIPETMLEYIWDYGFLDKDTERKYVETMLKSCSKLASNVNWFKTCIFLISKSQNYLRTLEDVSSVSLRDVARYCRLYNWFYKSIVIRKQQKENDSLSDIRRAGLIALLLCYYFRLVTSDQKSKYVNIIEKVLIKVSGGKQVNIENFLKKEEMDIVNRMELPKGTAANRALRENIFATLSCIINRIPIVLCGKPGCSKTSAVQIIISNLKGKKSKDPYFQNLPELVAVSYQGSQNCTSESIKKVFERADKYNDAKSEIKLLPVIVFDEIGLAELSPHNPLKVLHFELEVENCKYGFVGISNWRLDASKMNRALYLACPDPDPEDLKLTGITICKNLVKNGHDICLRDDVVSGLATAYYDLYNYLMNTQQKYENYFGLRDYYSLIKGIVNELTQAQIDMSNENQLYEIIRKQLKINFDGVIDGSLLMWKSFCEQMNREEAMDQYSVPTFKQLLDQSLHFRTGRYLMLISETESLIDYVERYINSLDMNKNVRTLIGSQMSGDLVSENTYTESYSYRALMDIILHAETSITLIMRQMGQLYDNLYDLFNQSFFVSGGKQYCRIALGALYHPRCLVNDDFYCIVFMNAKDVEKCDAPFLNRFEKHIINFHDLVHPVHWKMADRLLSWLADLLPTSPTKHFPLLQHIVVNYSNDYVCNLVIGAYEDCNVSVNETEQADVNEHRVTEYCKKKFIRASSFDFPLALALKDTNLDETNTLIQQYYDIHGEMNLTHLIKKALEHNNNIKQIIYTYTQVYDTIEYSKDISMSIEEMKLGNLKTELDLINKIKSHYQSTSDIRLLLIRVDYHTEQKHLLSLKHHLLNALNEVKKGNDHFIWIVFHLQRNMLNQVTNEILFNDWSVDMIDDLNKHELISQDALRNPSYQYLASRNQFMPSDCLFNELIDRCLSKFRYNVANKDLEMKINLRRNDIIEYFTQTDSDEQFNLRHIVQEKIVHLIQHIPFTDSTRFIDWRRDLIANGFIIATCRSFNDAFQTLLLQFYDTFFLTLFTYLEDYSFIDSYLFMKQNIQETTDEYQLYQQLWLDCLNTVFSKITTINMNIDIVEIPLVFDLHFPCSTSEFAIINRICNSVPQQQQPESDQWIWQQLQTQSFYQQHFNTTILSKAPIFQYYYHDLLSLFLNENKIQLSTKFVLQLFSSNPVLSSIDKLKYFIVQQAEIIEILRIFEICTNIVNEETLSDICVRNFKHIVKHSDATIPETNFYILILTQDNVFYQLPPHVITLNENYAFKSSGDPYIENCLMNLIELIVSTAVIKNVTNIEVLSTTYSLISQGLFSLEQYSVNNLEKLRSFQSLIRCITTLITTSNNKSLHVFQHACNYGFNTIFQSCHTIHEFVLYLEKLIEKAKSELDDMTVHRTLIKLEVEFIKNWLADNPEEYCDILTLLNQSDNDLWKYSAKIFSQINTKLHLFETISEYHGTLEIKDDLVKLEQHLQSLEGQTMKVERLFVNRIHMNLMLHVDENDIDAILNEHYTEFVEHVQEMKLMIANKQIEHVKLIGLISWLKYYAQIYAFALNNDSKQEIMTTIDRLLTTDDSSFCSTLKIFIIKQMVYMSSKTFNELKEIFKNRNLVWIKPLIMRAEKPSRKDLILPTPLFEYKNEFIRVNNVLNQFKNIEELKQLVQQCGSNIGLAYSFYLWFIQYYTRYYLLGTKPENVFIQTIEDGLQNEITRQLEQVGYRFIISLCKNFDDKSYFHLQPTMSVNELHYRLMALNTFALFLSSKSTENNTCMNSLLFNQNRKMPNSYFQHLQSKALLGLCTDDPIVRQMKNVKSVVQERLDTGQIAPQGKHIYQCSINCFYMFYFENCGVPVDRAICPFCKQPIGASAYGVLIVRNPPQIEMSIENAFQQITQYVEQYNQKVRLGYYNSRTAEHSTPNDKSDHLNKSVSFRILHMLTHALYYVLYNLKYLSDDDFQNLKIETGTYFKDHYEKDYEIISKNSVEPEECYVWLYKMFNHMLIAANVNGQLNTAENVIQFEQMIEQQLVFPHLNSMLDEVKQYKLAYTDFVKEKDAEASLSSYMDEFVENELRYPYLNFFNITKMFAVNPIDEFHISLQTIPYVEKSYPITTFILKRLGDYENIQYLYPIVDFSNYLLQKFNHRIKRNDAAVRTINYYLNNKDDSENERNIMKRLYEQFLYAWYQLNLKQVRFGCQTPTFVREQRAEDFAENTSIAFLLLNTSKDDSSLLLAACLRTIAELQNELVFYYKNTILNESKVIDINTNDTEKQILKRIQIQTIKPEHVLQLNSNDISLKLNKDSYVINYEYGKSKDIIYDYEEIEITLRNLIGRLRTIDTSKFFYLNYQFELYNEDISLINDIRRRVKQQKFISDDRKKLRKLLLEMDNDDIMHYLGSLDYVFTYLRNINDDDVNTIQTFVEKYIRYNSCLNDNVFRRPPFSSIKLTNIIDLYELIEEILFDKILRNYIKQELSEEAFSNEERIDVIQKFGKQTYESEKIALSLKNIEQWISTLKRLMIRVLGANIRLDSPIQIYLERTDLWNEDVTEMDIQTINIEEEILLKHTYVILKGLEAKYCASRVQENAIIEKPPEEPETLEGQKLNAKTWFHNKAAVKPPATKVLVQNAPKKKSRV
ncbi:unnamed protein product [Didymodactylos carnosus]|uniref:AAA+ ATPase domain-containing protein n=1 Tax=Didymodactylos carnosus TaxID=1234261 RepID=A0A8S2D4I6_9BILA|nr:unnamed protein product [Didymodactylos carnosus]CAF3626364.1 unnamed protein product [Didymodactylos carnosus]